MKASTKPARRNKTLDDKFTIELRSDNVGRWLIATRADGEQRTLALYAHNSRDDAIVMDLQAFGVKL